MGNIAPKINEEEINKKYLQLLREDRKIVAKEWYLKNIDKMKKYMSEYHKANKDKERDRSALRRKEKPEELNNKCKEWRKLNPGCGKRYNHNRRVRLTENGGKLSKNIETKRLAFQKNRCAICRESISDGKYNLDHIMPLALGGKNIDANIQITCEKCNREKSNKDPTQFMREKGFLL